ncbi:RNA exonuclease 4-like [Stegodyphus dumicola]|uniref:RNA exonuclease 4-like n=1 Tax=Stegodyphus dumicola TaxID=202533 RepID=UPI0015B30EC6|nr:RNA exonuclease 4-like [Stegodyphus dumicola]XP_035226241.1 RNA exonuclease 4-like [Stegodyphus dumicola]
MGKTKLQLAKKKKSKKRKLGIEEKPIFMHSEFDGLANWLQIQKVIESTKEKRSEKVSDSAKKEFVSRKYKRFKWHSKGSVDSINVTSSSESVSLSMSSLQKSMDVKTSHSDDEAQSKLIKSEKVSPEKEIHSKKVPPNSDKKISKMEKKDSTPFAFHFEKSDLSSNCTQNSKVNGIDEKDKPRLTKAVAIDCEMVGAGPNGEDSILARVSIVNAFGECIYDEFVKPTEKVTDYRTHVSGIRQADLLKGKDLSEVQKDVDSIIDGRIVVGHALKHDFKVLFLGHPHFLIRDTSRYKPFRDKCGSRTPSLKKLTDKFLGCKIQTGEHNSVEDARAAMLLYLQNKREWEKQMRRKKPKKRQSSEVQKAS